MNYKEFYCSISVTDNNVRIIDGVVKNDTANIVHATLMNGTRPLDFSGFTDIVLMILRPDGKKIQAIAASDAQYNIDNPYSIEIADPKTGRVSFTLKGQATLLTGTHFAQIAVLSYGAVLTTARINYRVGEALYEENAVISEIVSEDEYSGIMNVVRQCSVIISSEENRQLAENLRLQRDEERDEIETNRDARMAEIEEQARTYFENAEDYVILTETYKNLAYQYALLAQEPSKEALAEIVASMSLATEEFVNNKVAAMAQSSDFDAGSFTDEDSTVRLLQIRRGNDNDLPSLGDGEMGLSLDKRQMYVGVGGENVPLNGVYEAGSTAPERTDILWVDTSTGSLKYHDGMEWKPTAAASFA